MLQYKAYIESQEGDSWAYGLNFSGKRGPSLIYHFDRCSSPQPVKKVGRAWVQVVDSSYKNTSLTEVEAVQVLYDTSIRILLEGKGLGKCPIQGTEFDRQVVVDYIDDLQQLLEVVRDKESVQSNP